MSTHCNNCDWFDVTKRERAKYALLRSRVLIRRQDNNPVCLCPNNDILSAPPYDEYDGAVDTRTNNGLNSCTDFKPYTPD